MENLTSKKEQALHNLEVITIIEDLYNSLVTDLCYYEKRIKEMDSNSDLAHKYTIKCNAIKDVMDKISSLI